MPRRVTTVLTAFAIALLAPRLAAAQAATALTVVATPSTSVWQQLVTIHATVAPATATGLVQFRLDGVDYGAPAPLSGGVAAAVSVSGLALGPHTVAATYLGDGGHSPSSGSTVLVVVQCTAGSDCLPGRACAANVCVDPATLESRAGGLDGCSSAGRAGSAPGRFLLLPLLFLLLGLPRRKRSLAGARAALHASPSSRSGSANRRR
jgi:hypothetical protein